MLPATIFLWAQEALIEEACNEEDETCVEADPYGMAASWQMELRESGFTWILAAYLC